MGLRPRGYCTRVLEGVLHACPLRARATKGTPAVPQCAHTFHGTCTDTRKVTSASHARARAARARARRWKRHLRGARTHGLAERTERVCTYHGTHGTAAPIGYYTLSQAGSESTRRGLAAVRPSCALGSGAATRGPRRLAYGTRTVVGAMVRLLHYSQGTRRVLAGYSWARAWNDMGRGSGTGRARHSHRGRTEHEHARGYCQRYRVPHGAGQLRRGAASVLTATCGEGTRTSVRRCVRAHAGVLADTNAPGLARRRTARHRVQGGRTGNSAD